MKFIVFGILVFIGFIWQARLFQRLAGAHRLWRTFDSTYLAPLLFIAIVIQSDPQDHYSIAARLAMFALIVYVSTSILACIELFALNISSYPAFATNVFAPFVLGSVIATGVALSALFDELGSYETILSLSNPAFNTAIIHGIIFALLFQLKTFLAPMVVCINLAWVIYSYLNTGTMAIWSMMENILLLIMEPAAAASAAPWYTLFFAILALTATGWDFLRSAEELDV